MFGNKEVKKSYVMPEVQVFHAEPCSVLAESGIDAERYNYLCPYMPETRCRDYNYSVRHKHGIFSKASKIPEYLRISTKSKEECALKNVCEKYKAYIELTKNERQY